MEFAAWQSTCATIPMKMKVQTVKHIEDARTKVEQGREILSDLSALISEHLPGASRR